MTQTHKLRFTAHAMRFNLAIMRHLCLNMLLTLLLVCACANGKPAAADSSAAKLIIDAAPSVVSYQGSSQTHTRFVIAPMGRSLGYVEPTNVNRTLNRTEKVHLERDLEILNISPVYVHN